MSRINHHHKLLTFLIASVFTLQLYGQADGDYRSRNTGNWNDNTTWQVYSGGSWINCSSGDYPGASTGAGTVEISNNHTVTITADVPNSIAELRIDGGNQDSYLQFNASRSLTVSGLTYLRSNSNWDEKAVLVDEGIFTTGSLEAYSDGDNNRRDAYVRISTGILTVDNDITLDSEGRRTYMLFTGDGDLFIGGTISGGNITSTAGGNQNDAPTSGTVIYNGSSQQDVGEYTYYNLTINNAAGVSLVNNTTVDNQLNMIQGNITTGSYTLIMSNSSAGSLTHVSGTVTGRLQRPVSTPLSVNYLFPVGTDSYYRPAVLNFSSLSAATNITAEFISTPPESFVSYTDGSATLNNAFSEGYWRFSSSGSPSATYSLTLTADGFISYTLDAFARITGRDDGNSTWRALGSHGSVSGNDVSRTDVTNLNTTSFDYALATCYTPVFMGYAYERNITIDYTKVAGGSDLYNFPVMINLTGQDFLKSAPAGQIYNSNGYDIVFTDEQYNQLDHQIETYDGTNGNLIAWVRIPVLSSTSNTVIKIVYGNPQITADQSVTSVWDSHYRGVWHLNDNNLEDFTSYGFAGTPYNTPSYPSGVIDNALGMNGSNEYIQVNNNPNINFAGNVTVSAWVYMNAGNRDQKIAGNQNNSSGGYKFGIYTNNKVEFEIRNSANTASLNRSVAGGTVLSTGQWYYLAGISSDVLDSIKTFVNGISERPFKKTGTLGVASDNLVIGKEPFQSSYFFSGRFDELRVSDNVRSDGWLRTEYFNQSSPSTFYTIDAVGVTVDNLPSEGLCAGPITLTFGYPAGGTYSGNPYISGNVFTPPTAGTYPITYTYIGGCGPVSITKDFIISDIPDAPVAPDKEYCTGEITYLEATTGENIKWYSGGSLVSTANPFSTGQTAPGTYTYTVTQTVNGCESSATTVNLSIFTGVTINTQPQTVSICDGDNAVFTFDIDGANLTYQWQEDGSDITDGGIYSGANTETLTLIDPGTLMSGKQYSCVVTTTCGTSPVTSSSALLTVTGQVWSGSVSTDWNITGNWACGITPELTHSVFIPNVTNKPVLGPGAPGNVNNITIESGSSLTITGNTLQISGSITNDGTLDVSDGTVEFNGSAPQVIGASVFAGNTVKNLIINNNAGVTLQGPLSLTGIINIDAGSFTSDGFLTLTSTASGTALVDGSGSGSISGNVTMQRYLPSGFGYKYFSSPFQSATVNEFGDDMDLTYWFPTVYEYDESRTTSGWVDYTDPAGVLEPIKGYAVHFGALAIPSTADVTGELNNGPLSITLYNNNNTYTQGLNLVGNPYPSPIDWDAATGWTKTNIDDAIYFFKSSTTDEYGGTYSSYVNGIPSDGSVTSVIPSMQGFFVHVSDGSYPVTGTLGMNNDVRVNNQSQAFYKSASLAKNVNQSNPLIRIAAAFEDDAESTDPLVIYIHNMASEYFDPDLEALKILNTDFQVPNLYSMVMDNKKLSINAIPDNFESTQVIPLGLKINRNGQIDFRIIDLDAYFDEMDIVLHDNLTDTRQSLKDDSLYSLNLDAGEYHGRFYLEILSMTTGIEDPVSQDELFDVYSSNKLLKTNIYVVKGNEGILSVFNITGQLVYKQVIRQPGYYEYRAPSHRGIYIINYRTVDRTSSRKIFIAN